MKVCVAQTKPVKGDIQANIHIHNQFIQRAITKKADLIVFSELSLTSYEPKLAKQLAITPYDVRLKGFQKSSDQHGIIIGIGAPTITVKGTCISLILFRPYNHPLVYSKQYLHPDEVPYFVPGDGWDGVMENGIAFAICYELSIPKHAETAKQNGAKIYVVSAAKTTKGVKGSIEHLQNRSKKHAMVSMVCNCIGFMDDVQCAGGSFILNTKGEVIESLNHSDEGLLLYDTAEKSVTAIPIDRE